jgi:hypothetical protein
LPHGPNRARPGHTNGPGFGVRGELRLVPYTTSLGEVFSTGFGDPAHASVQPNVTAMNLRKTVPALRQRGKRLGPKPVDPRLIPKGRIPECRAVAVGEKLGDDHQLAPTGSTTMRSSKGRRMKVRCISTACDWLSPHWTFSPSLCHEERTAVRRSGLSSGAQTPPANRALSVSDQAWATLASSASTRTGPRCRSVRVSFVNQMSCPSSGPGGGTDWCRGRVAPNANARPAIASRTLRPAPAISR